MSYAPIESQISLTARNHFSETIPSLEQTPSTHSRVREKNRRNGRTKKKVVTNGSRPGRGRQINSPLSIGHSSNSYPIIVHCHLCWDWVCQRPQQFLSRLSARHKVLFIETIGPDPQLAAPLARVRTEEKFPNVTLLRLQFPQWRWSDSAYVDAKRRELVRDFVVSPSGRVFQQPVQWFYDPMAVTAFAGHMGEVATVYDCMDELSKFACAPPEIIARERELLARADVVFTGGRRLWESKSRFNGNCHFYGCGVDAQHFGKARDPAAELPADLAAIRKPACVAEANATLKKTRTTHGQAQRSTQRTSARRRPVLGYFGVVDERMDYELLTRLADANPSWSIAMIGPVLKVDAATLPQRGNLHWLGGKPYSDLPAYCKGFDVCLMPFALNEATEFINPTKALEYMATGRPIVSSAVPDVVRNFGEIVKIARSHDEFISLCRQALTEPDAGAVESGLKMAGANSWDSIVSELENHIRAAIHAKQRAQVLS
jgi:glycosyltransferase involved in cell wall biosynthesis